MGREQDIRRAIEKMAGKGGRPLWVGKVTAAEGDVCRVEVNGLELEGVRLRAVDDGSENGMRVTPKAGSYVVVADVSGGRLEQLVVVGWSEVEKIEVNGGELGGLVKVQELTDRLNALERDINKLKNALTTWVPAPGDGGALLKTATASWAAQPLAETQKGDIEDEKIRH